MHNLIFGVIFSFFILANASFASPFSCSATVFLTWKGVEFYKNNSATLTNLNNEVVYSHSSTGHLFRNDHGQVYLLPSVEAALLSGNGYLKPFQEAVAELRTMEHGREYLMHTLSEDIRAWATKVENISHQGEDVPSREWGTRTKPYRLPDGRIVYLSPQNHSKLVNNWATSYRPADM